MSTTLAGPQPCNRCGRHIARTETAHVWNAAEVVCTECFTGLRGAVTNPPPQPPPPAPEVFDKVDALRSNFVEAIPFIVGAALLLLLIGLAASVFESHHRFDDSYAPGATADGIADLVSLGRFLVATISLASITIITLLALILRRLPPR